MKKSYVSAYANTGLIDINIDNREKNIEENKPQNKEINQKEKEGIPRQSQTQCEKNDCIRHQTSTSTSQNTIISSKLVPF